VATRSELRKLIEVQDYKCAGTGIELKPHVASLDHKTPRSLGGANDIDNLHIIHDLVNKAKADMDWPDFVAMCHSVARHHDDTGTDWWEATERRRRVASGS